MRDESSQNCDTIHVRVDRPEGPYLRVATGQVPQVQVLLDGVGLKYTVAEETAESDDCEFSIIAFDADTSAEEVQQLLDELD